MEPRTNFTIRANTTQYKKYLVGIGSLLSFFVTMIVIAIGRALLHPERLMIYFVIIAIGVLWIVVFIIGLSFRARAIVTDRAIIVKGAVLQSTITFDDIARVIYLGKSTDGETYSPTARLYVIRKSTRKSSLLSLRSLFYTEDDLQALGRTLSTASGVSYMAFKDARELYVSGYSVSEPRFIVKHPVISAVLIVALLSAAVFAFYRP